MSPPLPSMSVTNGGMAVTQLTSTSIGILLAIALYSPTAVAAGSEAKAQKTSHARAVHRVKVLRTVEAKAAQKPNTKVAVASKKMPKQNATKYKPVAGEKPKPLVLSDEKSNDTSLPIIKRVAISITDDHSKFPPASDSSAHAPAELQNVNAGEDTTIKEIYATVIKTQQIYIPQKPGCDAIENYRRFRLSDADDWRRIACLQASGSGGFGMSE
jgi:DICT domain-containing protein